MGGIRFYLGGITVDAIVCENTRGNLNIGKFCLAKVHFILTLILNNINVVMIGQNMNYQFSIISIQYAWN